MLPGPMTGICFILNALWGRGSLCTARPGCCSLIGLTPNVPELGCMVGTGRRNDRKLRVHRALHSRANGAGKEAPPKEVVEEEEGGEDVTW